MWKVLVIPAIAMLALPAAAVNPDHAANMAKSQKLFTSHVRTVLKEHCVRCHGGEKTKSGFDLVTRESLLKGGDQGEAVVLGRPEESLLYLAVAHIEKDLAMPPKKPKLAEESIRAIEEWIELGAAYDQPLLEQSRESTAPLEVNDEDRSYWAYAPLRTVHPPTIGDDSLTEVDRFILDRLRREGLVPSKEVGRRALIRRAYFDLIGLPPSPEEVQRFLNNKDPDAYGKLIEDLLSRPGYGERWGRHWLDVARFAESHGFEHDYNRNFAYHYRDFVIRALNADMPFDQFVKWQIAGDEIAPENPEAMAATGFMGAGVYPTQITVSEAERIRFDATDDMIATIGSAMLATTVGCARCHDHKYDPIGARDYYEFLSAFTTTVRSEVEIATSKPDAAAMAKFETSMSALKREAEAYREKDAPGKLRTWLEKNRDGESPDTGSPWTILQAEPLVSKGGTKFTRQPDGSYLATGPNATFDTYTFVATLPLEEVRAIRIEALAHQSMKKGGPGRASNGNFALSHVSVTAGSAPLKLTDPRATFNQSDHLHVAKTIDGDQKSSWAVDPQFGKDHAAVYAIANPEAGGATKNRLTIKLDFQGNSQHNIGRLRISVSDRHAAQLPLQGKDSDPATAAARELLALDRKTKGTPEGEDFERMIDLYLQLDADWAGLTARISTLEETRPQPRKEKMMVCSEGFKPMRHHTSSGKIPDFYKESYYLKRGDPAQKDGQAPQGFLKVLMRNGATPEKWIVERKEGSRTSMKRSGVANWITDVEDGAGHLLARVIVNRLWQHHFGRGLVATPNDFGFQGSKPTHPDLLDYLARDLIAHGWSLKHLHKKIMMSQTYAMGSSENATNKSKDPDNAFWWKRDPRRLEAEIIRDNALAVSGLIDRKMHGPGTLDEKMKRRSIYFLVKRSKLIPMMQLFDWPDTMTSLGRRSVTTTPSQALVFINSPQVREMAQHFAKSLSTADDPVTEAVLRAHGKAPDEHAREKITRFLDEQAASYGGNREQALVDFCHALLASNEMIYVE